MSEKELENRVLRIGIGHTPDATTEEFRTLLRVS
jgi:hypothetical protein